MLRLMTHVSSSAAVECVCFDFLLSHAKFPSAWVDPENFDNVILVCFPLVLVMEENLEIKIFLLTSISLILRPDIGSLIQLDALSTLRVLFSYEARPGQGRETRDHFDFSSSSSDVMQLLVPRRLNWDGKRPDQLVCKARATILLLMCSRS